MHAIKGGQRDVAGPYTIRLELGTIAAGGGTLTASTWPPRRIRR
jgi:hypothetical protein